VKLLITGGAGYIGSALIRRLAVREDIEEIVLYDNLSRSRAALLAPLPGGRAHLRLVRAELLDTRTLSRALDGIDTVVHLAARVTTPFAHDDLHGFDQINRWGTGELGLAIERTDSVRRVIYTSSTAVYGDTRGSVASANDNTPCAPATAYGHSKWQGERLLEALAADRSVTTLRLGNVSGPAPSARFDSLLNRLLFDAWFSGRIQVQGSGEQRRALLHVQTAARVIERALLGLLEPGTYDLVDRTASVLDVVRAIRALLPETEVLFISQHLTLPDARVASDPRLPAELHDQRPIGEWLHEMATGFAFSR
jgi:UDP-glucose 4-epimerase